MEISLKINKGFKWFSTETIFLKGYFYDQKNNFYEKENALNYLSKIKNKEDFLNLLDVINGVFSVIINIKNTYLIASDCSRAFPLFYSLKNKKIYLSDDITYLKNTLNIQRFNPLSEIEIKASNHTHGKKTLLESIFQVQSNEFIIIENNTTIQNNFYESYAIKEENSAPYIKLKKEVFITFESSFKRMINSLNNKMVVIPLSGGFDSRLIAVLLKKYNYKNVVCYTYGNLNSLEIKVSKKVAKQLGFKWFFIEYNSELTGNIHKDKIFKEFAHFAGKFCSTPNLQEYFAVKHLKENNLIHKESIFIPGYAGDLLGGSQFLKIIPKNLKTEEIIDLIIENKFYNYKITIKEKELLKNEIENNLKNSDINYHHKLPSSVFENYDIAEKIAKYIFNSISFYNFFGYEHRVPFWDRELLNLFKKIPVKFKLNKVLFNEVLIEEYFKKFDVYFNQELQPTSNKIAIQKIKNKVKPFFPIFIKQKVLRKNDWNNYEPITNQLLLEMKQNGLKVHRKFNDYNEIIAQWYIYLCQNKLK